MKSLCKFLSCLFWIITIASFVNLWIVGENCIELENAAKDYPKEIKEMYLAFKPSFMDYIIPILNLILNLCLAIFFNEFGDWADDVETKAGINLREENKGNSQEKIVEEETNKKNDNS